MKLDKEYLKKKFDKSLAFNEKLAKYSWFNLGGAADLFLRPTNKEQLIEFIQNIKKKDNLDIKILGAGSNTLIRDGGFRGAIIKLGSKFATIKQLEKDIIEVGAGALDKMVSEFAKNNNIGNLEFLSCIPGSIGGAVCMNSGCYDSDISKILKSIIVLDKNGNEKEIKNDEIKFVYRDSNLSKDNIIISAVLQGKVTPKDLIQQKQNKLIEMKKNAQPSQIKTCGSTFKNPKNIKAWQLIKKAGCENLFVGDAIISKKHCNFFVNQGNAKASDIEQLIQKVKLEVKNKTGVELDLEIKIIGNEK